MSGKGDKCVGCIRRGLGQVFEAPDSGPYRILCLPCLCLRNNHTPAHPPDTHSRGLKLLLAENSFEAALGKVQDGPFTPADRVVFEHALLDAFLAMDREIARVNRDRWINIHKVQDLLCRFWGQRGQNVDTGYLFTLNQDLWPERHFYNQYVSGAASVTLPGLQKRPNQRWFTPDLGPYGEAFVMQPLPDPAAHANPRGCFNVVKLHGSFNWRTSDGRNELVVGTGKTDRIATSPLLSWYWEIFKSVLSSGNVRLLVVGYGFADDHVNAVIADAVDHHGLKLFIWDTGANLRDRVNAAPYGPLIWKGVLSTATRPMIEVFPSSQDETEEYRRICRTLFG